MNNEISEKKKIILDLEQKEKNIEEKIIFYENQKNFILKTLNDDYNEYKINFGLIQNKTKNFDLNNFFKKIGEDEINSITIKKFDTLEQKCKDIFHQLTKDDNNNNLLNKKTKREKEDDNEINNKSNKIKKLEKNNSNVEYEKIVSFNIISTNTKNNNKNDINSKENIQNSDNKLQMLINQINNINKIGYFNPISPSLFDSNPFSFLNSQKNNNDLFNLNKINQNNSFNSFLPNFNKFMNYDLGNSFFGVNNFLNKNNINNKSDKNIFDNNYNENINLFSQDDILKFSSFMKFNKNKDNINTNNEKIINKKNEINTENKNIKDESKNQKNDKIETQKYLFSLYKPNIIPENISTPITDSLKVIYYSIETDELSLININLKESEKNNFPERYYKLININNMLYIIGGENSLGEELNNVWKLEFSKHNKLKMDINFIIKMKEKRRNHNVIYLKKYESIFVCGGEDKCSSEYINIKNGSEWKLINQNLHRPIKEGCLFILNDTQLFLIGGFNTKAQIYNQRCEMLNLEQIFESNNKKSNNFWDEIFLEQKMNLFMKSYMGVINNIYKDKITILGGDIIYQIANNEIELYRIHQLKNYFYNDKKNKLNISTQEIKGLNRLSHLLFSDNQSFTDLFGNNEHFKVAFTNQNKLVKFNCKKGGFSFKHLKNISNNN